jgi:hypothetical protein
MTGGEISGNSVSGSGGSYISGGGVYLSGGNFEMTGGTISGNSISGSGNRGGGVYVFLSSSGNYFTMTSGTIYGGNAGGLSNTADNDGVAIYINPSQSSPILINDTITQYQYPSP